MSNYDLIDMVTTRLAIMTIDRFPYQKNKKKQKKSYTIAKNTGKTRIKHLDMSQSLELKSIFPDKKIENKVITALKR